MFGNEFFNTIHNGYTALPLWNNDNGVNHVKVGEVLSDQETDG
jgi:hypothetical protein